MPKRIFLFIFVNMMVILTISISLSLLGVNSYLSQNGIDFQALLIFCTVVGFAGSFLSLMMSRFMAKAFHGVVLVDPNNPNSSAEEFLLNTVYQYAQDAGITTMPEVGVYQSPEVNAFATGSSKNSALVAVSLGLLQRMDRKAVEGVIAHEVAHIANGDMVTMTLVQGVINTFVMFFARVIAWVAVSFFQNRNENEEGSNPPSYFLMYAITWILEILLSILGSIVVCFFSRVREYAADKGGAELAGREKMIHALRSLKATLNLIDNSHQSLTTLKINSGSAIMELFATHPQLDDRIARLRNRDMAS